MPWKGEKDPYKIWLSEIILQQTRVEQGLSYYTQFIKAFPDIHSLANAQDENVFKHWEGLGYYSRCRNLIHTARYISSNLEGRFPETYNDIMSLKGIGPYTASAISSFAFNLPYAVVDGNVFRVLSRVFGVSDPVDSSAGRKVFENLAQNLLDRNCPGEYNQAIMDFGATICKPLSPHCEKCPFNKDCFAYINGQVNHLPTKKKKIKIKKRWFYFLVMEYKNEVAIHQRMEQDIWQQLFQFPLIETEIETNPESVINLAVNRKDLPKDHELVSFSPFFKQQLSHQLIIARFVAVKMKKKPENDKGWIWLKKDQLAKFAFPRIINHYQDSLS